MTNEQLEQAKYVQEWWKVAASILTPLILALLTYFVSKALGEREADFRRGEQVLKLKQESYGRVGDRMNKIYVYVADVGDFRYYSPEDIIGMKREADREVFSYAPFWSNETLKAYHSFIHAAFQTYTGAGQNAKIRSSTREKKAAFQIDKKDWHPEWNDMFTGEREKGLEEKYKEAVKLFLVDITSKRFAVRN